MDIPKPRNPGFVATVWLDYASGSGMNDSGQIIRPPAPGLAGMLELARAENAARIMLCGKVPEGVDDGGTHWVDVPTPGWAPGAHWLGATDDSTEPVTARYKHDLTSHEIQVREAREWFGTNNLDPRQLREAWALTAWALAEAIPGAVMFLSPTLTGQEAWLRTVQPDKRSRSANRPPLGDMSEAIEEKLRAGGVGQGRVEHLVSGPGRCDCGACLPMVDADARPMLDLMTYTDGRFMYGALCSELGTGAVELTGREVADMLADTAHGRYARGRYLIDYTVPTGWDHVGLLPVKVPGTGPGTGQKGRWHYPNRPGTSWQTWADATEVRLALEHGWAIDPVEGVEFPKGARPLDRWAAALVKVRDRVDGARDAAPVVRKAASAALRMIVITTIGAFASKPRGRTVTVTNSATIPAEHVETYASRGDMYSYQTPARDRTRRTSFYHRPELAWQVWGASRARVLAAPTALRDGKRAVPGGVLASNPRTLLAIQGDAVYTTDVPWYAMPTSVGGGDDGAVGRLRLKGVLYGDDLRATIPTPLTTTDRYALRDLAEGQNLGDFR